MPVNISQLNFGDITKYDESKFTRQMVLGCSESVRNPNNIILSEESSSDGQSDYEGEDKPEQKLKIEVVE